MKKVLVVLCVLAVAAPVFAQAPKYHGSARNLTGNNQVWMFDATGSGLLGSYDQVAGAAGDSWGYRDGASDGSNVYFGWGGGLATHPGAGGPGTLKFGNLSGLSTIRALAYDPRGNKSFWTADFASNLVQLDFTTGNVINSFPNLDNWSLYGLSFDDTDGNLWGHSGAGDVIKIKTSDGRTIPGVGWPTGFVNLQAQGGLSGFSELPEGPAKLTAVSQGTPDEAGNYDLTGTLVEGPWNWEGLTGSNGHLGVAVIPEPASLALLALGGLALLRRR